MLNPRVQVLGEAAGVMSFVMQCQVKQKYDGDDYVIFFYSSPHTEEESWASMRLK